MPLYDFEDVETGEEVEVFMDIGEAPPFGAVRKIDGRRLRRTVVMPQMAPVREYRFASNALPREDPKNPKWPCDKKGRPLFNGKRDVQEYTARSEGKAAWDEFEDSYD